MASAVANVQNGAVLTLAVIVALQADIDRRLDELWTKHGVAPAARTTDAEFLRRVTLDLTGTVPSVDDARRPPADRAKLVDALLASDAFARHWAERLGHSLLGYPRELEDHRFNRGHLVEWLRARLAEDAPWDGLARDMLTATGSPGTRGPIAFIGQFTTYIKDEPHLRPEEVTSKAAEEFLGVRLRCAQCHDHPFDRWTQTDFLAMTSFFRRTGYGKSRSIERTAGAFDYTVDRAPLPDPRYLDGSTGRDDPAELAVRLTADPQFARAFVNRVWAWLFGRGLVEPYNDFSPSRRAVAPELVDDLAAAFRRGGLRIRPLVRAIVLSEAYQRSSLAADAKARDLFAAARIRPLVPEQLFGAIDRATALPEAEIDMERLKRLWDAQTLPPSDPHEAVRAWFLRLCVQTSAPESAHATSRYSANSIHALTMLVAESPLFAGARARARILAARPREEAITEMYLATLSRAPTAEELRRLAKAPLDDVFWCLLNCDEFVFNH